MNWRSLTKEVPLDLARGADQGVVVDILSQAGAKQRQALKAQRFTAEVEELEQVGIRDIVL